MLEQPDSAAGTLELAAPRRALVATSAFTNAEMPQRCGDDCYSYYFVYRAFAPLLARWGAVVESTGGGFALDDALYRARGEFAQTAHLSFLPPHYLHVSSLAPNIAFPFWEFPDLPQAEPGDDLRMNWAQVCQRLSLILTACEFTREAFVRAGVRTPIRVVPVPIRDEYFQLAPWQPGQRATLDCPCYMLPANESPAISAPHRGLRQRARSAYRNRVRPYLPQALHRCLAAGSRAVVDMQEPPPADPFPIPYREQHGLELSGVVYTSIFNPFDQRKNWRDLMAAFLRALGDREDATLVLKLAVSKTMLREGLYNLFCHYQRLRIRHRAKVAVVATYLSDEQMLELTRASAFYLNASYAEGACLPLQDFLAASRPGIAPAHTAMSEYIDASVAFVPKSHREPTHWPWDAERRPKTSWNRIDRRSLEEQLRASYEVAKRDPDRYRAMAQSGRRRMHELASAECVWPRLAEALALVQGN
jgi:glycosyltransferase involved in cell wall biosynthesis